MNIWLTADTHFGHANIIGYCGRPFAGVEDMNETLIRNWNSRVRTDDLVYVLGDLACYGGKRGVPGVKATSSQWLNLLDGSKILIEGNHDRSNRSKRGLDYARITAGGYRMLMVHDGYRFIKGRLLLDCDAILCGHVHQRWAFRRTSWGLPLVNVGVDVRGYSPIRLAEVLSILQQEERRPCDNPVRLAKAKCRKIAQHLWEQFRRRGSFGYRSGQNRDRSGNRKAVGSQAPDHNPEVRADGV